MKVRVVGGPVEGGKKVECTLEPTTANWLDVVQEAVGQSVSGFVPHQTELDGKKVKALGPLDTSKTPGENGLKNGSIIMFKSAGSSTPRSGSAAPTATASPEGAASPTAGSRSYKERLTAMFEKYEPAKLGQVDTLLVKFQGKEEQVISQLVKKHGPEPAAPASPAGSPSAPAPAKKDDRSSSPSGGTAKAEVPPLAVAKAKKERTYRERLIALYEKYDPAKVGQVDKMLAKYSGKEEQVISQLVKKMGPEPEQEGEGSAPAAAEPSTPVAVADSLAGGSAATTPTPARTHRERIVSIFQKYDPGKVNQADALLKKHAGKEENIINQLVKKYGAEPTVEGSAAGTPAAKPQKSYKERVAAMYKKYAPDKLNTVDKTLEKFKGQEEQVISQLVKKYGPEPTEDEEATPPARAPAAEEPVAKEPSLPQTPTEATPISTPTAAEPTPVVTTAEPSPEMDLEEEVEEEHAPASSGAAIPAVPLAGALQQPSGKDRSAVTKLAMNLLGGQHDRQLQQRYWAHWRYVAEERAVSNAVARAVANREWEEDEQGGFRLVDGPGTEPGVHSLVEEYTRRREVGCLPDELCSRTRTLSKIVAKELPKGCHITFNTVYETLDSIAPTLEKQMLRIESLEGEVTTLGNAARESEAELQREKDVMLRKTAEAEATLGDSGGLQEQIAMLQDALSKNMTALQASEAMHKRTKEKLHEAKKEIERERQGVPTNVEQLLGAKDETIAKLHQQLAKGRATEHGLKCEKEELKETLQKQRAQLLRSAERRARSPSPGLGSPPSYLEPTIASRRRFAASRGSQSQSPLAIMGPKSTEKSLISALNETDNNFLPDEDQQEAILDRKRDADEESLSSVDDDVVDLEPLPDRGVCPHCLTHLTAFNKDDINTVPDHARVAFCFSCRRSFTAKDLRLRDQRHQNREQILSRYSASPNTQQQRAPR